MGFAVCHVLENQTKTLRLRQIPLRVERQDLRLFQVCKLHAIVAMSSEELLQAGYGSQQAINSLRICGRVGYTNQQLACVHQVVQELLVGCHCCKFVKSVTQKGSKGRKSGLLVSYLDLFKCDPRQLRIDDYISLPGCQLFI